MKVIICGGGIIGAATAYFLAKMKIPCTIIEQEEIACAASGKAGGFLARNWCQTNVCDNLAKLSFDLHMEFSRMFDDVDYRKVNTYAASINTIHPELKINLPADQTWIDGSVTEFSLLETSDNTAQVHPKKLCNRLIKEAIAMTNGKTEVVIDSVVNLELENLDDGKLIVKGVKLEKAGSIFADKVLIAMGPWSHKVGKWLPKGSCNIGRIFGHRAHSIVLSKPSQLNIPASCLFLQYRNNKGIASPEIYPRPDNTIYISGFSDECELPEEPSGVQVEKWRCTQLREVAYATCSHLETAELLTEQSCYLPLTSDGIPVIGQIPGCANLFISAGHSCWGILNSTGSGLAMAELLVNGHSRRVNLQPFDPARFTKDNN